MERSDCGATVIVVKGESAIGVTECSSVAIITAINVSVVNVNPKPGLSRVNKTPANHPRHRIVEIWRMNDPISGLIGFLPGVGDHLRQFIQLFTVQVLRLVMQQGGDGIHG